MKGLLADINAGPHLAVILIHLESTEWLEIWQSLQLTVHTFVEIGLAQDTPDSVIWQECQNRELVLITNNRNNEGEDSLEATIRQRSESSSLPVVTIGDAERVLHDRHYASRVTTRLLEHLIDMDSLRGTGRLWVP
jgi:hypothetical protein